MVGGMVTNDCCLGLAARCSPSFPSSATATATTTTPRPPSDYWISSLISSAHQSERLSPSLSDGVNDVHTSLITVLISRGER